MGITLSCQCSYKIFLDGSYHLPHLAVSKEEAYETILLFSLMSTSQIVKKKKNYFYKIWYKNVIIGDYTKLVQFQFPTVAKIKISDASDWSSETSGF